MGPAGTAYLPDPRFCETGPAANRGVEEGFTMSERRNIASRMAHWSAHHRKIAIFGWLAFCLGAFFIGTAVIGTNTLQVADAGVRESGRMDRIVDKKFKTPAQERVIVQSATLTTLDPRFKAVINDVLARLHTNRGVTNFKSPLEDTGLVSADHHSVLIDFELTGDPDTADDRVQPILDKTAA